MVIPSPSAAAENSPITAIPSVSYANATSGSRATELALRPLGNLRLDIIILQKLRDISGSNILRFRKLPKFRIPKRMRKNTLG